MTRRLLASALLIAAVVGCTTPVSSRAPLPGTGTLAARAAGGFHDLQGKSASLASFAGKPLVLSFLSPGQADSEAQLPLLIRLADAYAADGVAFLVAGPSAKPAVLKAWATANDLAFPVWEDRQSAEFDARRFKAVPAHEFRRADATVQHAQEGFMSRGELTERLEALVRGAR